jgi:hypothetical protein
MGYNYYRLLHNETNNLAVLHRRMKRFLQDEIVRDIVGSAASHQELEAEFSQIEKDREDLRSIFPSGNSKVSSQ